MYTFYYTDSLLLSKPRWARQDLSVFRCILSLLFFFVSALHMVGCLLWKINYSLLSCFVCCVDCVAVNIVCGEYNSAYYSCQSAQSHTRTHRNIKTVRERHAYHTHVNKIQESRLCHAVYIDVSTHSAHCHRCSCVGLLNIKFQHHTQTHRRIHVFVHYV